MSLADDFEKVVQEVSQQYGILPPVYDLREEDSGLRTASSEASPLLVNNDIEKPAEAVNSEASIPLKKKKRKKGTIHSLIADTVSSSEGISSAVSVKRKSRSLDDIGNGERLVDQYGDKIRYCYELKHWFVWTGKLWAQSRALPIELAKRVARNILQEAWREKDQEKRDAYIRHYYLTSRGAALREMLKMAESCPNIPVEPEELDTDRFLFNVENGTLDLRTGKLRPYSKTDLITKIAPVIYDEKAECPKWLEFLNLIFQGDKDLIAFIQRALGMTLTGDVGERVLFILHGVGQNGKSTILNVSKGLFGDYWKRTATQTLLAKRGDSIPNDIAALRGARFVAASETEQSRRLNESLVKDLCGNEVITARFLHQEFFEFWPEFKIWLSTNYRPVIRGTDNAIWDRIRLIPFNFRIPDERKIKNYENVLLTEGSGILRWMVEGCLAWQKNKLGMPKAVKDACEKYKKDSDVLGDFIGQCCLIDPVMTAGVTELHEAFVAFSGSKMTRRAFGQAMRDRGHGEPVPKGKSRRMTFIGIGLIEKKKAADSGGPNEAADSGGPNEAADSGGPEYQEVETQTCFFR